MVWSSTLLYIDFIWWLAGNALKNYYVANNPWLMPFCFPMNFDAALNVTGMLVICGFRLGLRKELKNWCKHLLSKAGITTVQSQKVVPDAPPQFDFDSRAYDDVSKEGRRGGERQGD